MLKKIIGVLLGAILSASLILSIPFLNMFMNASEEQVVEKNKSAVSVIKKIPPKVKKETKKRSKPKRSKVRQRVVNAGPRFGMDLGVMGSGGASIPLELIAKSGGGAMGSGDVDSKPQIEGSFAFRVPREIREAEKEARLQLSFCVSPSGKATQIQVVEESPRGLGLAEAGKKALENSSFEPATKDGQAVTYCGMEQPVEVRFND